MDRSCQSESELSEWIGAVGVDRSCLSVIKTDSWFSDSSDYSDSSDVSDPLDSSDSSDVSDPLDSSDSSDVSDPLRQLRNTDYVKQNADYVKSTKRVLAILCLPLHRIPL